jgi:hypothetical protein
MIQTEREQRAKAHMQKQATKAKGRDDLEKSASTNDISAHCES